MLSIPGILLFAGFCYIFVLIGDYLAELTSWKVNKLIEDANTILDEDGNLASWYLSPDFSVG